MLWLLLPWLLLLLLDLWATRCCHPVDRSKLPKPLRPPATTTTSSSKRTGRCACRGLPPELLDKRTASTSSRVCGPAVECTRGWLSWLLLLLLLPG
jgi:hypothetical protein